MLLLQLSLHDSDVLLQCNSDFQPARVSSGVIKDNESPTGGLNCLADPCIKTFDETGFSFHFTKKSLLIILSQGLFRVLFSPD